ncbi:hypothetical protein C4565_00435 [Candidatus Parcubacteria bacterium]|nr:MAG: hypothetical protein C4565_00435 [Candidatus Parcubacteria bacterium]
MKTSEALNLLTKIAEMHGFNLGAIMVPSLSINDLRVQAACITNSEEYGYGVWSWNKSMEDAQINAEITGGMAVPVDWINGEVIVPNAAQVALSMF